MFKQVVHNLQVSVFLNGSDLFLEQQQIFTHDGRQHCCVIHLQHCSADKLGGNYLISMCQILEWTHLMIKKSIASQSNRFQSMLKLLFGIKVPNTPSGVVVMRHKWTSFRAASELLRVNCRMAPTWAERRRRVKCATPWPKTSTTCEALFTSEIKSAYDIETSGWTRLSQGTGASGSLTLGSQFSSRLSFNTWKLHWEHIQSPILLDE